MSLDKQPEDLAIDQVVDHIILVDNVQMGLFDLLKGKVNSKEDADKNLANA